MLIFCNPSCTFIFVDITNHQGTAPTDLRTPTPFTYIDTVSVLNCATAPSTGTGWYTAYVGGATYPAVGSDLIVYGSTSVIYVPYTFQGLIVTALTPGEVLTMVNHTVFSIS
jgi:hypothetical protein